VELEGSLVAPTRPAPRRAHAVRKLTARRTRSQRRKWLWRLGFAASAVVVCLLAWASLARRLAPASNTSLTRFDVIIVLGTPADSDGNPTPELLARVTEGVTEYQRGIAPRMILTGGPAHNRFVEAAVMARTAEAQGIPESAIFTEPAAMDTIQNVCYAARIMKANGWQSAEVVSTASHLPRAGLILDRLGSRMPLEWRTHAVAEHPGPAILEGATTVVETLKTVRYLVWTRQNEACEP